MTGETLTHTGATQGPNTEALGPATGTDHPEVDRILAERAAKLARRNARVESHGPQSTVIVIQAGGNQIGINAVDVREIVKISSVTPVADAHRLLLGLVSIHNEVISLLNPLPLVGEEPEPGQPFTHAVVLRHDQHRAAVACQEVVGLKHISSASWDRDRIYQDGAEVIVLLPASTLFAAVEDRLF